MRERIQKILDRIESRISLWQVIAGTGILSTGGFSAWVGAATDWIASYGPIGWWATAVVGMVAASIVVLIISLIRLKFEMASAIKKWKYHVDTINPLDAEFQKRRITVSDLENPADRIITNKRFIDCELVGPANIAFIKNCIFSKSRFVLCDVVVLKPHQQVLFNVIGLEDVDMINCLLIRCTLFIYPALVPEFKAMGAAFATITGDEAIDSLPHLNTATGTQR